VSPWRRRRHRYVLYSLAFVREGFLIDAIDKSGGSRGVVLSWTWRRFCPACRSFQPLYLNRRRHKGYYAVSRPYSVARTTRASPCTTLFQTRKSLCRVLHVEPHVYEIRWI